MFFKRAQLSLEYIFLIGFLLLAMIPVLYYAIDKSSSTINVNHADDAVNVIANTVDRVYSLGPGSKDYVWVTLPYTMVSNAVYNKEIVIRIDVKGSISDIHMTTTANLTGSLPSTPGVHKIAIEMLNSGVVQIGGNVTPTCLNQGYVCCDSCMSGTGQSSYDGTCSGQACCGLCYAETCSDSIKNQDESDVDCGGACGATCTDGEICNSGSDCVNLCNITTNRCYSPALPDPVYYYVDSAADELIFTGVSNSGTWQSTNARDLAYRVIDEQGSNETSTIFSDGFEDQVITDAWTVFTSDGSVAAGSYEHSGSYAIEADDFDNCGNPGYIEKTFDLSNAVNASLAYWYYPGDIEPSEWMRVNINDGSGYVIHTTHTGTDNGDSTPNPSDYVKYTVSLNSYDLISNFKVKFTFCGDASTDNHWLDDISLTKTIQVYKLNTSYVIDDISTGFTNYQLNMSGKSSGENFRVYSGSNLLGNLTSADSYISSNISSYIANGYFNLTIIDANSSDSVKDSAYIDFITVRGS